MNVSREKVPNRKRIFAGALLVALVAISVSSCARRSQDLVFEAGAESPWRYSRGGAESSGAVETVSFNGKLDVIWERKLSEKPQGPLSLSHNTLFYTGAKKRLFAINPETGATYTKLKSRACPQSGVIVVDSLLYHSVAPPFNQLDCRRSSDGGLLWRSHILDVSAPLSVYEAKLFVVGGDGILYCFNRFDGELIWEFNLNSKSLGGVALQEREGQSAVCWVGASSGVIRAIDVSSGTAIYEDTLDGPLVSAPAVGKNNAIYLSSESGSAFALRALYGSSALSVSSFALASRSWSAPATSGDFVVFADNSGALVCFTGSELASPLWKVSLKGSLIASPIIVGGFLIAGTLTGDIYCFELASGDLVSSRKLDYAIRQAPISDGSSIYVATQKRHLYRLGELHLADLE